MTRPSPAAEAPPPPPPATRMTPARDTANPAHATGRATACCHTAAMTATRIGVVPISSAAWVTLVRVIPAFCRTTDPPYPIAPEASMSGVQAARTRAREAGFRAATQSRIAAASPKRTAPSQPGCSHCRASLDSGTVVPHSSPAAMRAATARRRFVFMPP